MEDVTESGNINTLWLENCFDNLKKIEENLRVALNGSQTLEELIKIYNPHLTIAELKYEALKCSVNEMSLLIQDLKPIIPESIEEYLKQIGGFQEIIRKNKASLLNFKINFVNNKVISVDVNERFYTILDLVIKLKLNIIEDIKEILYIKQDSNQTWKNK